MKLNTEEIINFINDCESLDLLTELNTVIKQRQERIKKHNVERARKQIKDLAEQLGVDVHDLVSQKLAPKYRNPDNPTQVWAGRGKQPVWLVNELSKGRTLDEFKVNK